MPTIIHVFLFLQII